MKYPEDLDREKLWKRRNAFVEGSKSSKSLDSSSSSAVVESKSLLVVNKELSKSLGGDSQHDLRRVAFANNTRSKKQLTKTRSLDGSEKFEVRTFSPSVASSSVYASSGGKRSSEKKNRRISFMF